MSRVVLDGSCSVLRRSLPLRLGCRRSGGRAGRSNQHPVLGNLPDGLEDDVAYLERAMETERFSAIPGSAFGAPGTVRLGYAGVPLESMEALGRHMRELAEEMLAERK